MDINDSDTSGILKYDSATRQITINFSADKWKTIDGAAVNIIGKGELAAALQAFEGSIANIAFWNDATEAVFGGVGSDIISGGPGNDVIDGGDGTDTAIYDTLPFDHFNIVRFGSTITISGKTQFDRDRYGNDTLTNIEYLKFHDGTISIDDPRITESSAGTTPGSQTTDGLIVALGGGASGNENTGTSSTGETIVGTDGQDYLRGTSGPDAIFGGGGDDVLTGYGGQDTFDGGPGSDTVDYSYEPASVSGTVDLAAGTATFPGFYIEQLTSIENVWMGAGDDFVYGDDGDNDLRGGPGNDTLKGGLGNDKIYGDWKYSDQSGIDTAILTYTFGSGYTVSGSTNALHIVGAEGDDWYYNVENFQFAGGVTKTAAEVLEAAPTAPIPNGNEFQASAFRVYTDTERVGALDDGGFLATWTFRNNDSSISGVGGQRFGADGTKTGTEFEYTFSTASNTNYSAATAVLSDGTSIAVWNAGQILGQRLSATGSPIGSEFHVSTAHGGDFPSIAVLQDGKFVVAWHNFGTEGGNEIYCQLFTADGSKIGSEFLISDGHTLDFNYQNPSVAALYGGGFIVTSQSVNSIFSGGERVNIQRYGQNGTLIGSSIQAGGSDPSVVGLVDGTFAVVWRSSTGIVGCHYDLNGTPIGGVFQVSASTDIVYSPSVTALSVGGFLVSWTYDVGHDALGYSVFGQRFSPEGIPIGNEFRLDTDGQASEYYPYSAQLNNGNVVATWTNGATIEGQLFSLSTQNHSPNSTDDTFALNANTSATGNVLADNGHGADSDPDGDLLTVVAINGASPNPEETWTVTLASGALLVVNPDGRFVYDPNGKFDSLDVGQTANDSFAYTISDGQGHAASATVNITINGTVHGLQITNGSGTLNGTTADDQIAGGAGDNIIHGGAGYDWLQGGDGADQLYGDDGSDVLDGGPGNDTLIGGPGYDWLVGGPGVDTFVYTTGDDTDVVADFVPGTDKIDLRGVLGVHDLAGLTIVQDGNDSKIVLGSGLVLQNVNSGDLTATDFIFNSDYKALLSGATWWNAGTTSRPVFLTYSFETAPQPELLANGYSADFVASFEAFGTVDQALSRQALQQWDDASGIHFFEVPAGQGELRFAKYDFSLGPNPGAAGFSYYPTYFDSPFNFPLGGDVFISKTFPDNILLLLHEIGHAIGLKHPWEGDPVLAPDHLTSEFTLYAGGRTTLGPLDIEAAQFLYGSPSADGTQVASWSWDASLHTLTQNGTDVSDLIRGVSTNDVIFGYGGDDTISSNAGDDILNGGAGADLMAGGTGNDTYVVDNIADQIIENTNEGIDTVMSSVDWTLGAQVENLVLLTGAISGVGNGMSNVITGNAVSNTLMGGDGSDILDGGGANDTLDGGPGSDIAIYTGLRSQYQFTRQAGGSLLVSDQRAGAPEGTDDVTHVESFQFADGIFSLSDLLPTDQPPQVAHPISDQSAPAGQTWSFQFAADVFSDPEGDSLSYTARLDNGNPLPLWLGFDPATRTFSGTLDGSNGAINLKITASDGSLSVADTFTLNITAANHAPTVAPDTAAVKSGHTLVRTAALGVLANDHDPDGDSITVSAVSGSRGAGTVAQGLVGALGTLTLNIDGSFVYVADHSSSLAFGASAPDVFNYTAVDGHGGSASTSLTITVSNLANNPPVVTPTSRAVIQSHLHTIAASTLFTANDADGDAFTQYDFWNTGLGGGHWLLNGAALGSNRDNIVSASQLAQVSYQSGAGTDTLWVRANDGVQFGAWPQGFTVTDTAPILTPNSSSILVSHTNPVAASTLFTVSDADTDSITQYDFWDSGTGGGHWLLNGNPLPNNQENLVPAAQLSQLTYQSGPGTDTLWVRASDDLLFGSWSDGFTATDAAPIATPIHSVVSGATNIAFAATNLFTANDTDSDSIVQYDLWNSGGGGGRWLLNGVPLGVGQENFVTAAQLAQVTYRAGSSSDSLWMRANDGIQYGPWSQALTVIDAPVVTLVGAANVTVSHSNPVAATSLFTANDGDGDAIVQYSFWDSGSGGGSWLLNGNPLPNNQDVPASQLSLVTYRAGAGTETIWMRASDGIQFSAWASVNATDTAPTTTAVRTTVSGANGLTFAPTNLFTVGDGDGDNIVQYDVWTTGGGGADWLLNNSPLQINHENFVSAAQFAQLTYRAGTSTDTIWMRASDGLQFSAWSQGVTVIDQPVANPNSSSVVTTSGHTFAVSSLFTATDADGDTLTQFDFWDTGGGGGRWLLNGNALPTNQDNFVPVAQLAQVTYRAGSGTDTLYMRASDALGFGPWSTGLTVSDPPQEQTVQAGETLEVESAFSGSVIFADATGTLKLDNSVRFTGTVAGMTGQDTIDFADIDPTKVQPPSYNGDASGGTLNVTDGTHSANIALLGNYMASVFVASSDGHGGTSVTDPAVLGGVQPLVTAAAHA